MDINPAGQDASEAAALRTAASAREVAAAAFERAALLDHDAAFPDIEVEHLRASRLLAAPLPEASGGAGLGTEPGKALLLLDVLRAIGVGSLPLGRLYEGHVNAVALLRRCGGSRVQPHLRDATETLLGVWNTDDAGDALRLDATPRGWRLVGRKVLCSGAGRIHRPLVTARTPKGEVVMVMPRIGEAADLGSWRPLGMRASATGTVDFTGVAVSEDEIVGGPGDYHREPFFSGGAWRFAAVQLGGIEAVLDQLRGHLRRLGRHGDPYQMARVGTAALAAETARLWLTRAAQLAETGTGDPNRIVAYVNLARTAVERAGLDVLELAQRSVGLQGMIRPNPLERIGRDLATYMRQPAPDRALAVAAEYVLGSDTATATLW